MAFLHSQSCECTKSELDLFSLPPTQLSIERADWIEYKPVSTISENSTIEFCLPGIREEYLDLAHTMLYVKAKVVDSKGEPLKATDVDKVAPANNWLHTLFQQVDVYLNQKQISGASANYPIRAYIENLFNYNADTLSTRLANVVFVKDICGEMDDLKSSSMKERGKIIGLSKTVEMLGHLHADFFNQDKLLINGVEVKVKLQKSRDSYCLMSTGDEYKVIILDASLRVRRVKINPTIALTHSKILERANIKYPISRVEIKVQTLAQGSKNHTVDNLILGQMPKRIMIGFVSNTAYNGDFMKNPFNFQNFNLNYLSIYVDGQQMPYKPLKPEYKRGLYAEAYQTLFSGTGIHFSQATHTISKAEFAQGYCIYAFDLTPDLSAHMPTHWNLIRHGSLRVEVGFGESLDEVINMVLYAEYDNVIEIDKVRNVTTDFGS